MSVISHPSCMMWHISDCFTNIYDLFPIEPKRFGLAICPAL